MKKIITSSIPSAGCFFSNAGLTRPFQMRSKLRDKRLCLHTVGGTNRFDLFPFQKTIKTYSVRNNPREDLTWPSPVLIPTMRNGSQAVTIRNLELVTLHLAFDPDCVPTLHEPSIFPFLSYPVGKRHSTAVPTRTQRKTPKNGTAHMGRVKQFSDLCVQPFAKRHAAVGLHKERVVQTTSAPNQLVRNHGDLLHFKTRSMDFWCSGFTLSVSCVLDPTMCRQN